MIIKIVLLSHLLTRYNVPYVKSMCLKMCAKVWSHIPRQRVSAEPIEAYGGSSIGPILHSVQPTTVSVSVYCCKWFHMSTISAALMVNKSLLNRKRKTEKSTLRNCSNLKSCLKIESILRCYTFDTNKCCTLLSIINSINS